MIKGGIVESGPAVILDYEVPLYKLSKLYPFTLYLTFSSLLAFTLYLTLHSADWATDTKGKRAPGLQKYPGQQCEKILPGDSAQPGSNSKEGLAAEILHQMTTFKYKLF